MSLKQLLHPDTITKLTFGCSEPKIKKLITVCIHGDEYCGLIAVNELINENFFQNGFDIQNERITIMIGNPKAVLCNKRFVDINLNRIFLHQFLENKDMISQDSYEYSRLMELAPEIKQCDEYLDLHSTSASTVPFAIITNIRSEEIAKKFPVKFILHNVVKVIEGTSVDYALELNKVGCCVECGQHCDRRAVEVAKASIRAFLSPKEADKSLKEVLYVDKAEILRKGFKFCLEAKAFEKIQYDELVATDEIVGELRCPYKEGAFLVMPNGKPVEGEEAWLWGHSNAS